MKYLPFIALFALGCANASTPTNEWVSLPGTGISVSTFDTATIEYVSPNWTAVGHDLNRQIDTVHGSYRYYDGCNWTTCNNGGYCGTTLLACPLPAVTCQQEDGTWDWCR